MFEGSASCRTREVVVQVGWRITASACAAPFVFEPTVARGAKKDEPGVRDLRLWCDRCRIVVFFHEWSHLQIAYGITVPIEQSQDSY